MAEEKKVNAWKWLDRARTIDREIEALLAAKDEARDQLTKITQSYESDGSQSSKDPHKFDRLAELESLIDEKVDQLEKTKVEILAEINKLESGKQRTVLIDYYVRCMTFEEIAVATGRSFRNVAYTKKRGVQAVEKNLLNVH